MKCGISNFHFLSLSPHLPFLFVVSSTRCAADPAGSNGGVSVSPSHFRNPRHHGMTVGTVTLPTQDGGGARYVIQVMQTLASGHPADDEEYVDENDRHDDDWHGDGKYGRRTFRGNRHGEPGPAEGAAAAPPPPPARRLHLPAVAIAGAGRTTRRSRRGVAAAQMPNR